MPKMISKSDIRQEVMTKQELTLLKFRTAWSGTCQILEPVFRDLEESYKGVVNFYSVDVDSERGIEAEYGILELPTILFFRNGKIVDYAVGLTSRNILISKIENAIAAN